MTAVAGMMRSEWPLVGRGDVVGRLEASVVRDRRGVVLAGPAGVGKSRLAAEVLQLCRVAGCATAMVSGTRAGRGIPLGAFAPLLPGTSEPQRGAVDDRAHLLRRCAAEVVRRAGGRPVVLGVDDAHLLDEMSATLLHQLAEAEQVIVVVSVRCTEPAPDAVVGLWKDGLADRVEVGGLDADAVSELLTVVLGGSVDEAAVADLMARCGGNLLFLQELVRGALAEGVLCDEQGIWRLIGRLRPTDRLVELVEARLAGLTPPERRFMEVVAFGEPLGPAELSRFGGEAVAEVLERKGLLRSEVEGARLTVRLGHQVYGEALRERVPAVRVRSVARELAESVEATGARRREDLLRIASWRLTGGGADPQLLLRAAVAARWRYDFALAERLARAAVGAGAGFDAALLAAQLACLQGRSAQADAELEYLAARTEHESQRGRIALARFDNRVFYAGTVDEGLRITEDAESSLPVSELRDEIAARRCMLLLGKEGPRSAVAALEPLLSRASGRALAWACVPGSVSLARMGRISEALDAAERALHAQSQLTVPLDWYPWWHTSHQAEALAHAGRFGEAERLACAEYQEAVASRSLEKQAAFSRQLARTVADRGDVEAAVCHARKAISINRQLDRPLLIELALIYQTLALAIGHRPGEAEEAMRGLEQLGIGPSYYMGVDLPQARGWLAVAHGNLPRAREAFVRAADEGESIGDLVGAASALHGAARIGYPKPVAARLSELAQSIEGELAPARAAHARALASGDAAALETVSAEFESMGALLLSAEAAADAAVAWRRSGEHRRSASAQRRSAWLAAKCPGASTPALRAIDSRARLTPAEWEAARLAASGRSNREIAAKLVVSVRTVENRLQRVYGKLGVNSRTALAAALETLDRSADPHAHTA